jgi:hypothetical protein
MPLPQNNTKIAKQTVKSGFKIDFLENERKCVSLGMEGIDGMGR